LGAFFLNLTRYKSFEITENEDGKRLEKVLKSLLPYLSTGQIYKAIRKKDVLVNSKRTKGDVSVKKGDVISLFEGYYPKSQGNKSISGTYTLPPIILENENLVIYNKPPGLITQGNQTLETEHRKYFYSKDIPTLTFNPGPLHRLDKGTSGLVAYSLSLKGAQDFSLALKEHRIKKIYLTLVEGKLGNRVKCQAPVIPNSQGTTVLNRMTPEALSAETDFIPLASTKTHSLCLVELFTGRTHQIRAHAQYINHPLRGDKKYGGRGDGFYLHCGALYLPYPVISKGKWIFASLPEDFNHVIKREFNLSQDEIKKEIQNYTDKLYIEDNEDI